MGCISSKSSNHQQPDDQVIIPNHHFVFPSNINHTIDDGLKLIPPKHDHTLASYTNLETERCSSFHTVDELLQRISNHNDGELAGGSVPALAPVPDTRGQEKQDVVEFQTVASLRQWLNAPGGGDADAATGEYAAPKAGFSFYENNSKGNGNSNSTWRPPEEEENNVLVKKTGKQEDEESIVELVAAFDKYMQQLHIDIDDEDNILKQIHNMIN